MTFERWLDIAVALIVNAFFWNFIALLPAVWIIIILGIPGAVFWFGVCCWAGMATRRVLERG